ncbi:MAG: EAL domain-containing protein [Gammaproteobacteria bacterium]|nr:EAL domain-containing protein [Gammaproteobacteria bacterium]
MKRLSVLIIDESRSRTEAISDTILQRYPEWRIIRAVSLKEALYELSNQSWNIILCQAEQLAELNTFAPLSKMAAKSTYIFALVKTVTERGLMHALHVGAVDVVSDEAIILLAKIGNVVKEISLQRQLELLTRKNKAPAVSDRIASSAPVTSEVRSRPQAAADARDKRAGGEQEIPAADLLLHDAVQDNQWAGMLSLEPFLRFVHQAIDEPGSRKLAILSLIIEDTASIVEAHGVQGYQRLKKLLLQRLRGADLSLLAVTEVDEGQVVALAADPGGEGLIGVAGQVMAQVTAALPIGVRGGLLPSMALGVRLIRPDAETLRRDVDLRRVIAEAHVAARRALAGKAGAIHVYDPATDAGEHGAADAGEQIKTVLIDALKNNRFRMRLQPIASSAVADTFSDYEVLLRLTGEDNAEISPAHFIPVAEQLRMMHDIDRWVVVRALEYIHQNMFISTGARLFVKISCQSILDDTFMPWLVDYLRISKTRKINIVFQIRERDAVSHPEQVTKIVDMLRKLSCLTLIENFGVHDNPAALLKSIPVDYVKFDRSLIHNIAIDPGRLAKLLDCARIARESGKKLIVPFVQDAETYSLLWKNGFDYIYGNFVQRPDNAVN